MKGIAFLPNSTLEASERACFNVCASLRYISATISAEFATWPAKVDFTVTLRQLADLYASTAR